MLQNQTEKLLSVINNNNSSINELNNTFKEFIDSFIKQDGSDQEYSLKKLVASLVSSDAKYLSVLANTIGTIFEKGYKPDPSTATQLIQYFENLLISSTKITKMFEEKVAAFQNSEAFDEDEFDVYEEFEKSFPAIQKTFPNEAIDWLKLEETYCCGIALFSVSVEARKEAQKLRFLAQQNSEFNEGSHWLDVILSVFDNEPFIAIEKDRMLGVIGKMSGVVNNFQLHILLQEKFPEGWFSFGNINSEIVKNAKGFGEQSLNKTAKGKWNMYDWTAVQNDLSLPGHSRTDCWIWGEGKPEDIPIFEGFRVIILGKATYERSWNAQRTFGKLMADLKVEQKLSKNEVLDWLKKMAVTPK